jgi:tRNA-dihydrouridine synthase C
MLGRGMVTDPGLALAIASGAASAQADQAEPTDPASNAPHLAWHTLLPLMADFWSLVRSRLDRKKQAGRLKQWLNFLRHRYPQAQAAYLELRTVNDPLVIDHWMALQVPSAAALRVAA